MTTMALAFCSALFLSAGTLLATAQLAALRLNADLYLVRGGRARALGLHALRTAIEVGVWLVIVRFGAVALVSALAGQSVVRHAALARMRRVS